MIDETALVLLAQQGDLPAFERLIIRYQSRVLGFALNQVNNWDEAEEVLQETFIKVFTNIHSLKEPKAFGGWVFRICRSVILTNQNRQCKTLSIAFDSLEGIPDDRYVQSEWNDYFDRMRLAISFLSPPQRELIQLYYYASLSYNRLSNLSFFVSRRMYSLDFSLKRNDEPI